MSNPKVLIVEDDASIGIVVSAALSAENIDTQICETVGARDSLLATERFDVMLTDVMLKDRDGIESLSEVKRLAPAMPIIIMSAQNTLETAVRASEIEAFEYFPKPFDLDDLVIAIKQAITRAQSKPSANTDSDFEANLPMVGRSQAMQNVYRMVARLLRNDLSVLILGESGTGKELVAEAIHSLGHRKTGPFIAVNMAAIPTELIEAELFGHEKGAFTGAVAQSIGRFEQAQGGTLFLDEIGDMPMHAQTRLLRALQSETISRIGGKATIKLDVRIIAATNQNLEEQIAKGNFREDLYYRLNVVPIAIPPLRERPEDVALLSRHFLQLAALEGLPLRQIDDDAVSYLTGYSWRGNVRELKNLMFRLALLCRDDVINEALVAQNIMLESDDDTHLEQGGNFEAAVANFMRNEKNSHGNAGALYQRALSAFELPLLQQVLRRTKGNQLRAAAMLGINRNTLRKKLTEHGLGS
jgi:two-component system, NtrC family, nitrogen regulation response regulator GlnG